MGNKKILPIIKPKCKRFNKRLYQLHYSTTGIVNKSKNKEEIKKFKSIEYQNFSILNSESESPLTAINDSLSNAIQFYHNKE